MNCVSAEGTSSASDEPIRGWSLLGHASWKKQIVGARLPNEIKTRVREVIQRCRLSRGEKALVTQELIAHFEDGLASGQTTDKLLSDFGDPKMLAPLIQNSKRRNRPMWKKALYFSGYSLTLLTLAYACLCIWFYRGKPTPSIDYLAQINQPITERPDTQKAWPIYRPMWIKYKLGEGGQFEIPEMWHQPLDDASGVRLITAEDPNWESVTTAFSNHSDLLQSFREGSRKHYFGIPLSNDSVVSDLSDEDFAAIYPNNKREDFSKGDSDHWSPKANELMYDSLAGSYFPHLSALNTAIQLFTVDLRIAISENDAERAVQDVETMLGIARHAAELPFMVCSLYGYRFSEDAFSAIESTLIEHPKFFDDQQLARIQAAVAGADFQTWFDLSGDRLGTHDLIQRVFTDDGNGDGHMTRIGIEILESLVGEIAPEDSAEATDYGASQRSMKTWVNELLKPTSYLVSATRKETVEAVDTLFERLQRRSKKSFWESRGDTLDEQIKRAESELNFAFVCNSDQAENVMFRIKGRQEAVRGAIALIRFHRASGQWPQSWSEIPEEILKSVPLDQLTGEGLKFKITKEQPVVYSLGNDRDDDGGHRLSEASRQGNWDRFTLSKSVDKNTDGDWILWPHVADE